MGCASQNIKGWINVDYSIGAFVSKIPLLPFFSKRLGLFRTDWSRDIYIHDLRKKFPWADNDVDFIYSSHTLEHLTRQEGHLFIQECFRVLKPGGIVRIVVPDLSVIVAQYSRGDLPAHHFVEELGVLYDEPRNVLMKFMLPYISSPHKCMYDKKTLLSELRQAGFDAQLKEPFESLIADIKDVEDMSRTIGAVIAEAVKS